MTCDRKLLQKMEVKLAPYPRKRKLKPGSTSLKAKDAEALTWVCPKCKKINLPERHLLVVLPVLKCACGRKSDLEFDFSMHKVEVNDTYLIPRIRQQEPKQCQSNSLLSTAEISWRVNSVLAGQKLNEVEPHFSLHDLLEKYDICCTGLGIQEKDAKKNDRNTLERLCKVIARVGVESEGRNPMRYKLPYYTAVKRDFPSICQLLADGYAMTASMYCGKKFRQLKPGKIYKSPCCGPVGHAVTLVGAGRRRRTNYFHFVNSWGRTFCARVKLPDPNKGIRLGSGRLRMPWRKEHRRDKARMGFGMLRARDIRSCPVTFLRHHDEFVLYKKLLEKHFIPNQGKRSLEPVESSSFRP